MTCTLFKIIMVGGLVTSLVANLCLCGGGSMETCPENESQALLSFKASLYDYYGSLSSWVNGTNCCQWKGILCDVYTNNVIAVKGQGLLLQGAKSDSLCHLSFLTRLDLRHNGLTGNLPACLGNLSYFQHLNLHDNKLSGEIPGSICLFTRLTYLDLGYNQLNGSIPSCLRNLSAIAYLYLDGNQLSGTIPPSLSTLSSLQYLDLHSNKLSGSIPNSLGNLSMLATLDISSNKISGTIPCSFAGLSSLKYFYASGNAFNETIDSSALPASLSSLWLSLNNHQIVSDVFFHNLTKLSELELSNCVLNITTTWIPTFQLNWLSLTLCNIDAQLPAWISTQFTLENLLLAGNNLVGEIPTWLWDTIPSLQFINLTGNHLEGCLFANSSTWRQGRLLDVSNNKLSGHIPSIWSPDIMVLLLNDNLLIGNIPPSLGTLSELQLLNLANNKLKGIVPPSLASCTELRILDLGYNSLYGSVPTEFRNLNDLYSLVIQHNFLNGSFPYSIIECERLQVLDIGHNSFQGHIPKSIANISDLRVLVMKQNYFRGNIPSEIGALKYLQILDISFNHVSGIIPPSILGFESMAVESQDDVTWLHLSTTDFSIGYKVGIYMSFKGIEAYYNYIYSSLISIDLSHNQLNGDLPFNFGKLKGLKYLNLSANNLSGAIPSSFGEMSLESLDLSTNRFSGKVPSELESLNYLGYLNLSNNNLSGNIPQGGHLITFDKSSYSGNPNLWGCPLPKNCSWPEFATPPPQISANKEKRSKEIPWYEIGVGLCYVVSFVSLVAVLAFRIEWRKKYFKGVDIILKFLFPPLRKWTL